MSMILHQTTRKWERSPMSYGMLFESVTVFEASPTEDDTVLSPRYNYIMTIVLGTIALIYVGVWVIFVLPWSWGSTLRWLPEDYSKANEDIFYNGRMFAFTQTSVIGIAFSVGWVFSYVDD